jgi:hypothetical protein
MKKLFVLKTLDVFLCELEASPVPWMSFMEAQEKLYCNFLFPNENFFLTEKFKIIGYQIPGSGSALKPVQIHNTATKSGLLVM